MNPVRFRMNRELRKRSLLQIVEAAGRAITVSEIAEYAGLKRTPYLVELLDELETEGSLDWSLAVLPGGWVGRIYYPRGGYQRDS